MKTRISTLLSLLAIGGAISLYTACSDDTNAVVENPDAGVGTSGGTSGQMTSGGDGDAGPPSFDAGNGKDCFDPPLLNHFQIINACTTAQKVVRQQTKSKLLLADGGLPTP